MRKWTDRFDVEVKPCELPAEVLRARRRFDEANANNEAVVAPRVAVHLAAYDVALNELKEFHERVANSSDLDLNGNSRQVAAWFVSGRVVGLLNAAMMLAKTEFASEMVPILRTAQEATQLLGAISMHRDTATLRDWLDGRHIKPSRVRNADDRNQKAIAGGMRETGVDPPERTKEFMDSMYEGLSEMAHVKRSRVLEIASVDCRLMPVDGHPSATVRAFFVYLLGFHVMHAVSVVGFGLGISLGDEVVIRAQETLHQLQELEKRVPIDPNTLRGQKRAT
jgi:hypothetical protein